VQLRQSTTESSKAQLKNIVQHGNAIVKVSVVTIVLNPIPLKPFIKLG
jgi:hypothetical protein